jgi:alpha-N-arabinofuranosidase
MNRIVLRSCCVTALLSIVACSTLLAQDDPIQLTVRGDKPGAKISPTMYGIFFEDINFGADGGLYAELVKNRAFEFPNAMMAWNEVRQEAATGSVEVLDHDPFNAVTPHYLRIKAEAAGYGVVNEGFAGMGVKKDENYVFSAYGRDASGKTAVRAELVSPDGQVLAEATIKSFGTKWAKKTAPLRPSATEAKAQLRIVLDGPGTVDLDMVALFPKKTWKNRPNGLRADLVQWLADLKPGFFRFPGGCIVEGRYLSTRYQWKNTIGAPEDRTLIINRWNDEFRHRPAPDYFQTFGLGFYEYFLMCEDIGAEPMPILNCGMACQFNSNELVLVDELQPYIQDALDLLEFANGPADSEWGAKRAKMGHPKPFNVKYLGVGNEQWGPQYVERYIPFAKALKEKYPEVQLIGGTGSDPQIFPNGPAEVKFMQEKLQELKADIIDEHFYRNPDWFFDSAGHYDSYPRTGPKIFVGEYAAQSVGVASPDNRNNLKCALSEAAFMTGLERNADLVAMSCYAPLFGHEERWQWRPDLIWFDNLQSYASVNYYVQQLFSLHRGDVVLPVEVTGQEPPTSKQPGLYVSSSQDAKSDDIILKVVNSASEAKAVKVKIEGPRPPIGRGVAFVLAGEKLTDENTLAEPEKLVPVKTQLTGPRATFDYTFQPYSLTVIRLRTRMSS